MEFKKMVSHWIIKIEGDWYKLCACLSCKQVNAFYPSLAGGLLDAVDKKIKCCKKPNNYVNIGPIGEWVKEFVEKWRD